MDQRATYKCELDEKLAAALSEPPAVGGLVFVANLETGITRRAGKNGFLYYDTKGTRISDPTELERISALAIPPAYTEVLISADPNSHLQATGRDARGRKQYRYHREWTAERDRSKFERLADFGSALPAIRRKVDSDLRRRAPDFDKALGTIVWLLDNLYIRVGNASYASKNASYGLTTLRNRHVKISGSSIHFRFKGKSGKEWRLSHSDPRITRAVRMLQELPGQQLFQYIDNHGASHPIQSQDVNAYIRRASGADFSSRQFRTWAATQMAAIGLAALEPEQSRLGRARQMNEVIDAVAARLVNTRAVCRSSYVHPKVFESFETGELAKLASARPSRNARLLRWMDQGEIAVLRWLKGLNGC
ncbi:DNA topoisomerase IB [Rhizobium sp. BK068]|uniref:DNA topoisomerase IB n=1 Tax=Rhizobium sp. BK068 TaxID=2512130 RepID=UPI00104C03F0|nr:DNA topoisomerase IB [Rhizobium sp. BK068]TCM60925.1 DNA topoisomerase-1 [Rhizobium sp. BK068]